METKKMFKMSTLVQARTRLMNVFWNNKHRSSWQDPLSYQLCSSPSVVFTYTLRTQAKSRCIVPNILLGTLSSFKRCQLSVLDLITKATKVRKLISEVSIRITEINDCIVRRLASFSAVTIIASPG